MIRNRIRSVCAAALLTVLCGAPALAQNDNNNTNSVVTVGPNKPENGFYGKSSRDPMPSEHERFADWKPFVNQIAMASKAEIEIAKLALQNASSDEVKQFAQRMIDDHTKAGDELAGLVQEKGMTLPDSMDAKHQALYNRLSQLQGAAFDKAYARAMLEDHMKVVQMFKAHANNGRNTDLRMWTAHTLGTLRQHLQMARELAASMGVSMARSYRRGMR